MLVAKEGRVRERGPVHAQKDAGKRAADRPLALGQAHGTSLGVSAVIADEHDDRVVKHATLLQTFDQLADAPVEALDHGGIDRHDRIETILLLGRVRVPGWRIGRAGRKRPASVDDAHLNLSRMTLLAQLVPTCLVFSAITLDHVGRRAQREMDSPLGDIEEEGFFLSPGLIDEVESPCR